MARKNADWVTLTHPDLKDARVTMPPSSVPVLMASGWVPEDKAAKTETRQVSTEAAAVDAADAKSNTTKRTAGKES